MTTDGFDPAKGAELFWSRVGRSGDCWPWTLARSATGYGRTRLTGGPAMAAHVAAYLLSKGPIPEGHHIDHLCYNPPCCNPDHLEAVTPAENHRRARERRGIVASAYIVRRALSTGATSWQVKWRDYRADGSHKWRSRTFHDRDAAETFAQVQTEALAA